MECEKIILKETLLSNSPIVYIYCVNVRHYYRTDNSKDTNLVRLQLHHEDGTVSTRIEAWLDYKVPFWVTNRAFRTYTQKKSREHLDKLDLHYATMSELKMKVARAVGIRGAHSLYDIKQNSPYVYGGIRSESHIKGTINEKLPEEFIPAPATYSVIDSESNSYLGNNDAPTIITTATQGNRAKLLMTKEYSNLIDMNVLKELCREHYPDWDITIEVEPTAAELVRNGLQTMNSYDTDYNGIWNISYDIPIFEDTLWRDGNYQMADLIHGFGNKLKPYHKYRKGQDTKVTSSGKVTKLPYNKIWNTVNSTSNGIYVDSMVLFNLMRGGVKEVPGGYGLDNILSKFINTGKLKLARDLDHLGGLDWHVEMQRQHPAEYLIYALYDVIGMIELDNSVRNVARDLRNIVTPIESVHKSSAVTDDVFYFTNLKDGWVNCMYAKMESVSKLEEDIYGLGDWIMVLSSYMLKARKLSGKYFKGIINTLVNSVSYFVQDNDLVSSYPTQLAKLNAALDTTVIEWCKHQPDLDISEYQIRKAMLNKVVGVSGARGIAVDMLSLPDFDMIDRILEQEQGITTNEFDYVRT